MRKKDFSDLEDQIMATIDNALKALDFVNLKIDITDKAGSFLNQFKSKWNKYNEQCGGSTKRVKKDISAYINKKPVGKVSGVICILFGGGGALIYGILAIASVVYKSLFGSINTFSTVIFLILLICFIASITLLFKGIRLRKRLKRFKKYVRFINNNSYTLIRELASFANMKENFILKDLNKMIDLGMFLEGHIDEEKTYFILSDEVYSDYLNLKEQERVKEIKKRKENEKVNINENKEEKNETNNIGNEEVNNIIIRSKNYISQIKALRDNLYKEKISIKIDKLQRTLTEIINHVEKNTEKIQQINKLVNHYLPMTLKLLNSYKELNNQRVQGENIKNAKIEIEKSIDVINDAFESLLDDLFEDMALDISTDISVLKTLFKKEGLGEKDFEK